MLDRQNTDGFAVVVEAHTLVPDAQPQFRRLDIPKALYIAFTRNQVASQTLQNTQRRGLANGAQIGKAIKQEPLPGWNSPAPGPATIMWQD